MPEQETLVVLGKMLIDGSDGPPVSAGLVAIAGTRVVYAGPAKDAPEFSPQAKVINLDQACLLPGLIDSHIHASYYYEEPNAKIFTRDSEGALVYSEAMIALLAARRLREVLLSGVTTVRDVGGVNGVMFDVRRAIDQGLVPGPRVYAAGRLIGPTGGHVFFLDGLSNEADGPFGFRRAVRQEVHASADFIKIAVRGTDQTQEELNAAVDEAHRQEKKVSCHVYKPPASRMALEAGADFVEHFIESEEELDLAAEKGVTWTPTLSVLDSVAKSLEARRNDPDAKGTDDTEEHLAEIAQLKERLSEYIPHALKAGVRLAGAPTSSTQAVPLLACQRNCAAW